MTFPSQISEEKILKFTHDGLERSYLFLDGKIDALVVVLHYFGGGMSSILRDYFTLSELGFSLLIPQGMSMSWNAGECCGPALAEKVDDVGFVRKLVQSVLEEKFSPTTKVYVTGISNGGFLTTRLALQAIKNEDYWIHGIAYVSGYTYDYDLYEGATKYIQQKGRFPVFAIQGLEDKHVQPQGCCDNTCCCHIQTPICLSFRKSIDFWAEINGCDYGKGVAPIDPFFDFKNEVAHCFEAKSCEQEVKLCEFPEMNHQQTFRITGEAVGRFFLQTYRNNNAVQTTINHDKGNLEYRALIIALVVGVFLFLVSTRRIIYGTFKS